MLTEYIIKHLFYDILSLAGTDCKTERAEKISNVTIVIVKKHTQQDFL